MTDDDSRIVDLYDGDNPDGPDHDYYRSLAESSAARTILDLGCGTGMLAVSLVRSGRTVVGIDPSHAMIEVARKREGTDGVRWIEGDSRSVPDGHFDLVLMTGHVPEHIPDAEWPRTLNDLRAHMRPGATLAFEARDPAAREWKEWSSGVRSTRETRHGRLIEWAEAESDDDRTVRLRFHNLFAASDEIVTVDETHILRSRYELEHDLEAAGFRVAAVYRDWQCTPAAEVGRIAVFVARAA